MLSVCACCQPGHESELLPRGLLRICPFLKMLSLRAWGGLEGPWGREEQDTGPEAMAEQGVFNTVVSFQGLPS